VNDSILDMWSLGWEQNTQLAVGNLGQEPRKKVQVKGVL
jgi:hypothetical protein